MPPSQQKLNHERFHVVRSMISLKYGNHQPIGHSLIVEAEKSLASWMAGNRQEKSKVLGNVRGGLGNLAHDYFRSRSQAEDGSVLKIGNASAALPQLRQCEEKWGQSHVRVYSSALLSRRAATAEGWGKNIAQPDSRADPGIQPKPFLFYSILLCC
eukprot:365116-Chlamydomonas_euryale.AAC.7